MQFKNGTIEELYKGSIWLATKSNRISQRKILENLNYILTNQCFRINLE
jgi:hypothetical protein